MSAPYTAKVPLANQIAEVERELGQRAAEWPRMIDARRLAAEVCEVRLRHMRGVLRTLKWLSEHEDLIRSIAEHVQAVKTMPGVLEFLKEFPEASVRRISTGARR